MTASSLLRIRNNRRLSALTGLALAAGLVLLFPAPARANDRMAGSQPVENAEQAPRQRSNSSYGFSGANDRMGGSGLPRREGRPSRQAGEDSETLPTGVHPETVARPKKKPPENMGRAPAEEPAPPPADDLAESITPVEPELPPVQGIDIDDLETYGLLKTSQEDTLGIDMWLGSGRDDIVELLPAIPAESRYITLNRLTERMLLTHTDSRYIDGGRTAPGRDLMTVRLEKLNDIGAFDESARLYAVNPGLPYHENMARAGVVALLSAGKTAQGCLEVKAVQKRYDNVAFWQQADLICDLILSRKPVNTDVSALFEGNSVLQKVVDKESYRFKPADIIALESLTPLERLAVFNLSRIDYGKIDDIPLDDLLAADASLLSAMLTDARLPGGLRMYATIAAVSAGAADSNDLAAFYESDKSRDGATSRNWGRIPTLYREAKAMKAGPARDAVIQRALALHHDYGTVALLPFAPLLADTNPGNLPPESIATSLAVMVKAGQSIPENWQNLGLAVLSPAHQSENSSLTFLAYDISQDFRPLKALEDNEFHNILATIPAPDAEISRVIYEKLDRDNKLHNSVADGTYEKDPILTAADDYVMPIDNLLDRLDLAEKDKRLGEVILISSILLRSTPPGKLSPEVLGEVLDSFKAVGLTREARDLSAEIILGLRN